MSRKALSLLSLVLLFMLPGLAAVAHAEFATSEPVNGAELAEPLDTVRLAFTGEVEPIGEGFAAMDSTGPLEAVSTSPSADGSEWLIRFDRVPAGDTVVRWEVKAPDAHPFTGAIRFVAPVSVNAAETGDVTEQALAEFADTDEPGMQVFGTIGRVLSVGGVMLSVGSLIFAALVVRGYPGLVAYVMYWVRRTVLLVPLGALLEFGSQVGQEGGIGAVAFSSYGFAMLLRLAGGVLLFNAAPLAGPPVPSVSHDGTRVLVAAGHVSDLESPAAGTVPAISESPEAPSRHLGVYASLMMVAAFLFDGHTVTEGARAVTGVFDVVHVLAGAVWAGGVAMLAAVLWSFRSRVDSATQTLVVLRFSAVAAVAVVGVALGGLALAVTVLDSVSELWSTPWGFALLVKSMFAGFAGACGAYNHKVLIPDLERGVAPRVTLDQIRVLVAVEATALVLLLATTGWLVGAAS